MEHLVTIERGKIDPDRCYGVIVAQSPALTLLHEMYDFQFDGYRAVRTGDVTRCESSAANEYGRLLMRREGLWEAVPRWVKKLPVEGWRELIAAFVGKVVILEDEKRDDFFIGPVLEARARYAAIHFFDGCGTLRDVERVFYGRITSMRFGNRYSTIHAKYLSRPADSPGRVTPGGGNGTDR